jgi:hypothetical protein
MTIAESVTDTAKAATPYAEVLLASVTIGVILPALLMFGILLVIWRLLVFAQRKDGFNIEQIFQDETGRAHPWRFTGLFAFAVHSAYFYATLFTTPDKTLFLYYGLIWGGTPAAMIMAEGFRDAARNWNGNMPFSKPPEQP